MSSEARGEPATGEPSYEEWLEEHVPVNLNTSVPRREYYRRYFDANTDPRRIFEQDRTVKAELRARGAVGDAVTPLRAGKASR